MPLPTEAPTEELRLGALRSHLDAQTGLSWGRGPTIAISTSTAVDDLATAAQVVNPSAGLWIDSDFAPESNFMRDTTRQQLLVFFLSFRQNREQAERLMVRWANYLINDVFATIATFGVPVGAGKGFVGLRAYAGSGNGVLAKRSYGGSNNTAQNSEAIVDATLQLNYTFTLPSRFC